MYGLDHAVLNTELPPKSMWMNMGFWKDNRDDFPLACETLLTEILNAAGLLVRDNEKLALRSVGNGLRILDLGYGCGDQTIYLANLIRRARTAEGAVRDHCAKPPTLKYTGLTLNEAQFAFANTRLQNLKIIEEPAAGDPNRNLDTIKIFKADAAKPASWPMELNQALGLSKSESLDSQSPRERTWVLALDTLYHFTPSREPVLSFAASNLNASIMAFDLLLTDHVSFLDKLKLRFLCRMMGTPYKNIMSVAQYREMLHEIGYLESRIEIFDISEHVFAPLAEYIREKDRKMKPYGLGSIGKFKSAASLFNWWAKSGLIKGCIVIAQQ